jgi:hypothetical protein
MRMISLTTDSNIKAVKLRLSLPDISFIRFHHSVPVFQHHRYRRVSMVFLYPSIFFRTADENCNRGSTVYMIAICYNTVNFVGPLINENMDITQVNRPNISFESGTPRHKTYKITWMKPM